MTNEETVARMRRGLPHSNRSEHSEAIEAAIALGNEERATFTHPCGAPGNRNTHQLAARASGGLAMDSFLETLKRELERIAARIDAAAAAVEQRLDSEDEPGTARTNGSTRSRKQWEPATAAAGITALERRIEPNGSEYIRLDGRNEVRLTPMCADLLRFAAADNGTSGDALVEWKPKGELLWMLAKRSGRPLSAQAFNQLVLRLRKALRAAGENPYFLQVHAKKGIRFALRRGATDEEP